MSKKSRILVIDDEIGICEGVKRALELEGFQVKIALDGRSGLALVKENGFDLVLLDVKMPEISGLDLIGMIHQIDPEIICIMITGYATVEMAVSAIKQGAYDFLTKPFSVDILLLAVNQGLERRILSLEAKRTAWVKAEMQKLAEKKNRLEELDQAKKQFIRLVTHELQSPVAAVENYLKLILGGYVPAEDQKDILEKCVARTQEERKLIADLLELGYLEMVESSKVSRTSPRKVLEQVIEEFREEIDQKGLDLLVEVGKKIPEIGASPEQIKSVWSNLISNAVKFTPDRGKITVGLQYKKGALIGRVQDTGIGIPLEDQKELFQEFFRARNAKETGIPGTGLGLVIVKRVVDGLGGEITVKSKPGSGTTFQFRIPA
ncbi:MAG: hybrid sensor histidine kinase/response regulator [Anaerolineales bacterium]|nr:hybrid sensor histidine kinase/response regulator [Anaerolineales bacterium]